MELQGQNPNEISTITSEEEFETWEDMMPEDTGRVTQASPSGPSDYNIRSTAKSIPETQYSLNGDSLIPKSPIENLKSTDSSLWKRLMANTSWIEKFQHCNDPSSSYDADIRNNYPENGPSTILATLSKPDGTLIHETVEPVLISGTLSLYHAADQSDET